MKTLKSLYQNVLFWFINFLLYPSVLGYYSENNTGGFTIINKQGNKHRPFGSIEWQEWIDEVEYQRIYNESLVEAKSTDVSFSLFKDFLNRESKTQPKVYFINNFIRLEVVGIFMWITAKILDWTPISFRDLTLATFVTVSILTVIDAYFALLNKNVLREE
jgi:hypothetical protein